MLSDHKLINTYKIADQPTRNVTATQIWKHNHGQLMKSGAVKTTKEVQKHTCDSSSSKLKGPFGRRQIFEHGPIRIGGNKFPPIRNRRHVTFVRPYIYYVRFQKGL